MAILNTENQISSKQRPATPILDISCIVEAEQAHWQPPAKVLAAMIPSPAAIPQFCSGRQYGCAHTEMFVPEKDNSHCKLENAFHNPIHNTFVVVDLSQTAQNVDGKRAEQTIYGAAQSSAAENAENTPELSSCCIGRLGALTLKDIMWGLIPLAFLSLPVILFLLFAT